VISDCYQRRAFDSSEVKILDSSLPQQAQHVTSSSEYLGSYYCSAYRQVACSDSLASSSDFAQRDLSVDGTDQSQTGRVPETTMLNFDCMLREDFEFDWVSID
jgi:hypothetical protein